MPIKRDGAAKHYEFVREVTQYDSGYLGCVRVGFMTGGYIIAHHDWSNCGVANLHVPTASMCDAHANALGIGGDYQKGHGASREFHAKLVAYWLLAECINKGFPYGDRGNMNTRSLVRWTYPKGHYWEQINAAIESVCPGRLQLSEPIINRNSGNELISACLDLYHGLTKEETKAVEALGAELREAKEYYK